MRLAVVGESTAAGCGVDTHDDGFPGAFAREVSARTGGPVSWEVVGQYGATSRRIRHRLLPQLVGHGFTHAIVLAGANDVLSRRAPAEWAEDLGAIVDELAGRAKHVIVVGIPPIKNFPSIPGTLRRHLARRAGEFDRVAEQVCAERSGTNWVSSTDVIPIDADFFARDKFHPSAYGYRRWAETVADHLSL